MFQFWLNLTESGKTAEYGHGRLADFGRVWQNPAVHNRNLQTHLKLKMMLLHSYWSI